MGDVESAWRIAVREAMKSLPADYPAAHARLVEMRREFLAETAAVLGPRLSAHVSKLPQNSYIQKCEIAHDVNTQMRLLNLCLVCPDSRNPCILAADFRDDQERSSRFRFQSRDATGRLLRKHSTKKLSVLEITEAPPREEGRAVLRGSKGI